MWNDTLELLCAEKHFSLRFPAQTWSWFELLTPPSLSFHLLQECFHTPTAAAANTTSANTPSCPSTRSLASSTATSSPCLTATATESRETSAVSLYDLQLHFFLSFLCFLMFRLTNKILTGRFHSCLTEANDSISDVVGYTFFNLLKMHCFEFSHQLQCTQRNWFGM